MFIIGIDPHKASHTATVIDGNETVIGELRIAATRLQRQTLIDWAAPFAPRSWAIEGASGVGALLAQQLVAAGEVVLDVPPALSARARVLDSGRKDKTDSHDARSTAIVALRHPNLRRVALEDHVAVLRMLARRHHQLTAARTRSVCRLHAELSLLVEGGQGHKLAAKQAAIVLDELTLTSPVEHERARIARELLDEVRHHDQLLEELRRRIRDAVNTAHTTVTDIDGVGSIIACLPNRPHRRCPPLRDRRSLRPLQRHRADRSIVGAQDTPPAEPERQPPAQPRALRRRARPDQPGHTRPRVLPYASKPKESRARRRCAR